MRIECNVDDTRLRVLIGKATKEAMHAVCEQALKDCNKYCKKDFTGLIFSSVIHTSLEGTVTPDWEHMPEKEKEEALASPGSDLENGILRWCMPYAEDQYKEPSTRTDLNPLAGPGWCETAENNHKREWEQTLIATLRREGLE